jgi:hypothetical protein
MFKVLDSVVAETKVTLACQVEEEKRRREGKEWTEEEQAAFKAKIAERCHPSYTEMMQDPSNIALMLTKI